MRGPAEAVKKLSNVVTIDMRPRLLSEVLKEIINKEGWHNNDETADELSANWANKFKARIRVAIESAKSNSTPLTFELNATNDDYIQGSCFIEPRDDTAVSEAKIRRSNAIYYISEFKSLTHKQFEKLSGRILSLFGSENEFVTRSSADQGIDFFGRVPFGELIKPTAIAPGAEKQLKIWLVGQSKHYQATQVSTKDIRELVGSVSLAKSKVYAGAKDPLSQLQMRTCDPVFFLFFTTGEITRDALDLLRKSGVVAMNGEQLAVFLADHKVGLVEGVFDVQAFRDWLGA